MPENPFYKTYSEFLAERFSTKMQKLSVNVGFTCPNRDGSIGTGGCSYCNNQAFVPGYCNPTDSVKVQLEKGKEFFGAKYPTMRYMAYFQAYTSTYSLRRREILDSFSEALEVDGIDALIVATRPDCIDSSLLQEIIGRSGGKRVMFEIGVESTHNATLSQINRGHTWQQAETAIKLLREEGIDTCAHLIMGLPGETIPMMLKSVERVCSAGITSLKLHQLQIVTGTEFHRQWLRNSQQFNLFSVDDYLQFCIEAIKLIPHDIAIERFTSSSPASMLVAPQWGLKNHEFTDKLNQLLKRSCRI